MRRRAWVVAAWNFRPRRRLAPKMVFSGCSRRRRRAATPTSRPPHSPGATTEARPPPGSPRRTIRARPWSATAARVRLVPRSMPREGAATGREVGWAKTPTRVSSGPSVPASASSPPGSSQGNSRTGSGVWASAASAGSGIRASARTDRRSAGASAPASGRDTVEVWVGASASSSAAVSVASASWVSSAHKGLLGPARRWTRTLTPTRPPGPESATTGPSPRRSRRPPWSRSSKRITVPFGRSWRVGR